MQLKALEDRLLLSSSPLALAPSLLPAVPGFAVPQYIAVDQNGSANPLGSSGPVGFKPSQIRHAYGIDQIWFQKGTIAGTGAGETIAIIDAYDDPNIASDLTNFDAAFGLPAPPSFTKVAQNGSTNYPGVDPQGTWELEESLDVEWAHAVAPGASIVLVEANDNNWSNLNAATDYARSLPGVVVVSLSFAGSEWAGESSFDFHYTTPSGHVGITFVAGSGDWASPARYPAVSPNVVGVGGTVLKIDSSGNYVSETGWSSSGGGISAYETQPAYQKGVVTQSSTMRTSPDAAFDASPGSGVAVYDSYNEGSTDPWVQLGGTSLGAPSWAGLFAIIDQGRALQGLGSLNGPGQALPALYQLSTSDFHDITSGNNGYAAGPGYDLVTGRGSPIAYLLVPDMVNDPSVDVWTGNGSDANWSDRQNWAGNVAPHAGDILVFGPGAAQLTTNNDFAAGTSFDSIRFTGQGYTIAGNSIVLTGNIDGTSATGANVFDLNVQLGSGAAVFAGSGSSVLTVAGNINDAGFSLFVGGGSGSVDLSGVMSGTGALNQGSSTLVLAGSNTYSGGTTLTNGTLEVTNANALGTGTLTLAGGTIEASGAAVTLNNALTLGGNVTFGGKFNLTFKGAASLTGSRTLTVTNAGLTTFAGVIGQSSGTWSLTEAGTGELLLSASNTFAGGTILTGGILEVGNAGALGTGTLTLNAGTIEASGGAITLTNPVTLGGNVIIGGTSNLTFNGAATLTGSRTLTVNNTGLTTFAGVISQLGGTWSLTVTGSNALLLSASNTFAGGTILKSGILEVGNAGALGTGTLTLDGGTIEASGGAINVANAVSLGGNVTIGGTSNLTFKGSATLTGSRTLTVNNTGLTTFAGVVSQSGGTWSLTKAGTGALLLSASNTYGGGTVLNNGTLEVGNAGALGTGTLMVNAGTIQASGAAFTLANAVTLAGNLTVGGAYNLTFKAATTLMGSYTLTVTNTGTTTFSGAIGQSGGTWSLTKAGSGKLALAAANTYSGSTTVSAGTLLVNGSQANSSISVMASATLGGSGSTGPITVYAGGIVEPGTGSSSLGILNTGNVTFNSSSSFDVALNGTTAGAGYDQLNVTGTVNLGNATLNVTLGFTPPIGTTFIIINNDGTDPIVGTFNNLPEGATLVVNGMTFRISYKGGSGNDVVLTRIV